MTVIIYVTDTKADTLASNTCSSVSTQMERVTRISKSRLGTLSM